MASNNVVSIEEMTKPMVARICDHTFLKTVEMYVGSATGDQSAAYLREEEFAEFLDNTLGMEGEAPYGVCVHVGDVPKAESHLSSSEIKIVSVVGFPDGSAYTTDMKVGQTKMAIDAGANGVDMVLNVTQFKQANIKYVISDINSVVKVAKKAGIETKLILENSELSPVEIRYISEIAQEETGVDFIKTSTGFGLHGAQAQHLLIMREVFKRGIKISGGVNSENLNELLYAASGRKDKKINLNPDYIRIGESSLLKSL